MDIRKKMKQEIDGIESMDVFPQNDALNLLTHFEKPLKDESSTSKEILDQMHKYGSPNTTAQTGGRYFGFVNGGAVPAALAAKWLTDVWDQNGGLFYTSAINAKLEQVCENWLKSLRSSRSKISFTQKERLGCK